MIYNPKIFIDKSPVHGWGVFAKELIKKDEIFEECPVLTLPINKGEVTSLLIDYRFNWPQGNGSTPPCVQNLTTSEGPYTYNEILDILATPEWTDPNPMGGI